MAPPAAPPVQEQPSGKQLSYQLAAAVRSINWTYAIFWSISTSLRPPGVLKWKDGFYNGEVKTRKIISSTTTGLTANDLVLQRSEQLRELYESLLSGKVDHRARRPAAALSPEDLGEAEWYYTLSMTYAFRPGQGLPGKSFVSNQHVWLHNAQYTDTKTFQRALLAKTAPIQTVVCIPFMGGVLELGTSDLVLEDPDMVNRIGTSFWELPFPTCSDTKQPSSSPSTNESGDGEVDVVVLEDLDHNNVVEGMISELGEVECMYDVNFERATKEVDEFYGLIAELDMRALEDNWVMDRSFEFMSSPEMLPAVDAPSTVDHVIVTLSSIVKGSHTSCFTGWKRSSDWEDMDARVSGESQKLLKKVVAGGAWTTRAQESNIKTHVLSERRRREKINEMFLVLKSLVPSINKMDKASILAETISYLKELEQRVEKLESDRAPTPTRSIETTGRRLCDINIGKKIKVSARSKRKAPELETQDDGPSNVVNVTMMDKEVLLEVKCRWKELLMTRVFDAIKSLRLDVVSVQASTPGGLLDLKIRASQQFAAGSATVSPGMITEVLQKAIGNS